ncbi:MAG: hypothetical protein KDD62_08490 [Bdellovibrionales bacterium]|nr:hypothetical protein [Bdellovibrionales bacterium]
MLKGTPGPSTALGPSWLSLDLRKLIITFLIWLGFVGLWYLNALKHVGTLDFLQYWAALKLLLTQANPYSEVQLLAIQQAYWVEPLPFAIVLYCPPLIFPALLLLAFLPSFEWAAAVWNASALFCLYLCVNRLICDAGASRTLYRRTLVFSVSFLPIYTLLYYGQVSHLLLIGLLPALGALSAPAEQSKNSILIGSGLALTFLKPHLLYILYPVLGFIFLKRRSWGVLSSWILCLTLLSVIPSFLNQNIWSNYLDFMTQPPIAWKTPTIGFWLQYMNGDTGMWSRMVFPLGLLFILALVGKNYFSYFGEKNAVLLLLPLTLITSPYGWLFDQVLLLPLLIPLLAQRALFYVLMILNGFLVLIPNDWGQEYYVWYPFCVLIIGVFGLQGADRGRCIPRGASNYSSGDSSAI